MEATRKNFDQNKRQTFSVCVHFYIRYHPVNIGIWEDIASLVVTLPADMTRVFIVQNFHAVLY